jgi:glutamine cyclotransferase
MPRRLATLFLLFSAALQAAPTLDFTLLETRAADTSVYTQGLEVDGDTLLVSSGGYGRSRVERRRTDDFTLITRHNLADRYFAEGLTRFGESIYLLSWENRVAWQLDPVTLAPLKTFKYRGQGWGLTHTATHLILSDGSSRLRLLDPATFSVVRTVQVTLDGRPLRNINELEYVDGQLWANIWLQDRIVQIDPETGVVTGILDVSALVADYHRPNGDNVLNGIAWDAQRQGLWLTGKRWPVRYLIRPRTAITAPHPPPAAAAH